MASPPPPPPPPHGSQDARSGGGGGGGASSTHTGGNRNGLPPGNYDIFVIPPHSSGSGFLYLPSLHPHRNSFLAGVASALAVVALWTIVLPAIRDWLRSSMASGGIGVILIMGGMGVAGWAWAKTQMEGSGRSSSSASSGTSRTESSWARPNWSRPAGGAAAGAKSAWERAREETRKKEDERRRAEELKKKREQDERERVRQREKDARERREREARNGRAASPNKGRHTFARTEAEEDAYSFRPYDKPQQRNTATSASSMYSESYAPSHSTSKTSPPPSAKRGPYRTQDADKIVLKAVYAFSNAFHQRPLAQLISGVGAVTDGLILRITTEGLFIDDDVRGVPQREWDVKAWTLKLLETAEHRGLHVLRGSVRDQDGKKYVFILGEEEGWKVAVGLQRLRRGTQVRAMGISGLPLNETKAILENLGYLRT